MKPIYHNYLLWEDYKAGMWRKESSNYEVATLPKIIEFTGNHIEYGKAMMEVITAWPISCEHNLTGNSLNKRAFIGHAACCLKFGWPEYLVRAAWNKLTKDQQILANKEADKAIEYYEEATRNKCA